MRNIKDLFYASGIIPVIKIDAAEKADRLASALKSGGLEVAEITFRTAAAAKSIEHFAVHYSDILVGAGTVTTKLEVDTAIDSGAQFIVSPGFNPEICTYCIEKKIPVFPGVSNPSLIEQAMSMGLTELKFFPAEVSGGIKALKAFEAVYPSVSFIPTGGIQESTLNDYLALKNVLACGGSWIVPPELIHAKNFDMIVALIRSCRRSMLGFLPLAPVEESHNAQDASIEIKTPSLKRTLAMLGLSNSYDSKQKFKILALGDTIIKISE